MWDTEILDGEIDLRELTDNVRRETKLPDTLFYDPDLVQVTVESSEFSSNTFVEKTDEITVEPLNYSIRSLNEFGYVMAHLLIRSHRLYKINHTNDDRIAQYMYKIECVGKLPRYLYKQLNSVKPILPDGDNESFDIMGIQVYLNDDKRPYPYKLNDGYYLPVDKECSVADIVKELMYHTAEHTVNYLGYEPKFDSKDMDKIYEYKE